MAEINYIKEKPENGASPKEEKEYQKLEKKMDSIRRKARRKEVRKVLLGNVILGEDKRLTPTSGINLNWWGTADGSFGARLFGIAEWNRRYKSTKLNEKQVIYRVADAMAEIGRGVDFETVFEGCSCLIKHFFFRPAVIIFEHDEGDEYVLSVYCGRDILTISSMIRARKLLEGRLPEGLLPIDPKKHREEDDK